MELRYTAACQWARFGNTQILERHFEGEQMASFALADLQGLLDLPGSF